MPYAIQVEDQFVTFQTEMGYLECRRAYLQYSNRQLSSPSGPLSFLDFIREHILNNFYKIESIRPVPYQSLNNIADNFTYTTTNDGAAMFWVSPTGGLSNGQWHQICGTQTRELSDFNGNNGYYNGPLQTYYGQQTVPVGIRGYSSTSAFPVESGKEKEEEKGNIIKEIKKKIKSRFDILDI